MPELPEVETIRKDLQDYLILPSSFEKWEMTDYDYFLKHSNIPPETDFRNRILQAVDRHGKKLIFILERGYLVFHLGMSGQIVSSEDNTKYPQHIKLRMQIGSKSLYFVDIRKFGRISYYPENEKAHIYAGMDPVKQNFDLDWLASVCQTQKTVKSLLMEQKQLVGIGNIYANEILFCAGIHPLRASNSLKNEELKKLKQFIVQILKKAIRNFGTTFSIFRNVKGREGKNSDFLKVYGRAGLKCLVCGHEIYKIIVQQRSTFFCPVCQK